MIAEAPTAVVRSGGLEVLDWTPEELRAWEMPDLVPTAEWVEQQIKLPAKHTALPGPVDLRLTPYLRGPFEAIDDPMVETITVVCGSQLGKTLFIYGSMCSLAVQAPGPMLLVMPVEADAREVAGEQLKEIVVECAAMMEHALGGEDGLMKEGYHFDGCNWYFAWSNAPSSLARRACRYVFFDEVDKFPAFVGKEADPISLGEKRLRTYQNTTGAKSVRTSTPTTEEGLIWKAYGRSDKRTFWVPCPKCGAYQVLVWGQVSWPKGPDGHSRDPDEIEARNLARYRCAHCDARWTDAQKNAAGQKGIWARPGQAVSKAGRLTGQPLRTGPHAGFHINAIYSAFTRLSQLAASWIRAQGDLAKVQAFVNAELGELWQETVVKTEEEPLWKHRETYKKGHCVAGVQGVTCCVDVQRGYFVYEVKGWGFGLEQWVLDYGIIRGDKALHEYLIKTRFKRGGAGQALPIHLTVIDSGDQTSYVYNLCLSWRGSVDIRPTKGLARETTPIHVSMVQQDPATGRRLQHGLRLYGVSTNYWKDTVARWMGNPDPGPGYMHLPADVDEEFIKQLCSEHRVIDRKRTRAGRSLGPRPRTVWKLKSSGRANHYWDCEIGNAVAAEILNLRALPDPNRPPPAAKKQTGKKDAWSPTSLGGYL